MPRRPARLFAYKKKTPAEERQIVPYFRGRFLFLSVLLFRNIFKLRIIQIGEKASFFQEFLVFSLFDDIAVF